MQGLAAEGIYSCRHCISACRYCCATWHKGHFGRSGRSLHIDHLAAACGLAVPVGSGLDNVHGSVC